jgi:hypothetical protein
MASGAIALLAAAAVISPTQAQDKSQAPAQKKAQPQAQQ